MDFATVVNLAFNEPARVPDLILVAEVFFNQASEMAEFIRSSG
ncbi:hypothetical protein [Mycobacteroides abscessus]|nr:hypothetical protein [Mycobacteroides abscessus]